VSRATWSEKGEQCQLGESEKRGVPRRGKKSDVGKATEGKVLTLSRETGPTHPGEKSKKKKNP